MGVFPSRRGGGSLGPLPSPSHSCWVALRQRPIISVHLREGSQGVTGGQGVHKGVWFIVTPSGDRLWAPVCPSQQRKPEVDQPPKPRIGGNAGLASGNRDPAVLVQPDNSGPAASLLIAHLSAEFPCAQPLLPVCQLKGSQSFLMGVVFFPSYLGGVLKEGLWHREERRTKARREQEHPTGSARLGWLLSAWKAPLVCRMSHSTALVWMKREEKRARDSCKVMGRGKGHLG